jgi:hypothetical protein
LSAATSAQVQAAGRIYQPKYVQRRIFVNNGVGTEVCMTWEDSSLDIRWNFRTFPRNLGLETFAAAS